jgi:hypothetical protein
MNPSGCCPHSEKEHCPGGVSHAAYKDVMRMSPNPRKWNCPMRHCTAVLCCCVGESQKEPPIPNVSEQADGLGLKQLGFDVFGH